MDQIGPSYSPTRGQRSCKRPRAGDAIRARLEHLDDLPGPETIIAVVGLVELQPNQLPGKGEPDEYDATVDMRYATPLVGVSLDTNGGLHCWFLSSDFRVARRSGPATAARNRMRARTPPANSTAPARQ
jgi:hypothetical protein